MNGSIHGGDGQDTFDYSAYDVLSPVTVNLDAATATGVADVAVESVQLGNAFRTGNHRADPARPESGKPRRAASAEACPAPAPRPAG